MRCSTLSLLTPTLLLIVAALAAAVAESSSSSSRRVFRFDQNLGGIPFDSSPAVLRHNTQTLSNALQTQGSNSTIIFPENTTFYLYNGVRVYGLEHAILELNGMLHFKRPNSKEADIIPFDPEFDSIKHPPPCFVCKNCRNITVTSTQQGVINGGGPDWWGIPLLGYVMIKERRPYLLLFNGTDGLFINNIDLVDAPFYNMLLTNVNNSEIHDIHIASRRTTRETHGIVDLSAFNTDGIDVAGHNIYIHDVVIWNQDDCIAVKDNYYGNWVSSNMTFERIHASGLGLVIGSISGTTVQNITFRDSYLYRTFKGIYMKFRLSEDKQNIGPGLISDILYENITMESPLQWPIWIGPAQQTSGKSESGWVCHPSPCSLCWPNFPFQQCNVVPDAIYRNITLKEIRIRNPTGSPGVIMGDDSHLIEGITFDNVRVEQGPTSVTHEELQSMFPLLNLAVDDVIAKKSVAVFQWTVIILLTFAVTLLIRRLCCCAAGQARETDFNNTNSEESFAASGLSSSALRSPAIAAIVLLSVIVLIAVFLLYHAIALIPKVSSPSHYFVCKGVRNGLATGTTLPVPNCFTDMTTQRIPSDEDLVNHVARYQVSMLLVMVALVFAYIYTVRKIVSDLKRRPNDYASVLFVEEDEISLQLVGRQRLETELSDSSSIQDIVSEQRTPWILLRTPVRQRCSN